MTYDIPLLWRRLGLVLERRESADGCSVAGDPCIVWDEDLPGWRMVLFFNPPGNAQAVCRSRDNLGPGQWELLGPLTWANPGALPEGFTHKPFIVMEAHRPNTAARVDGRFRLVTVSQRRGHKIIQRAGAERLAGPWTIEPGALIDVGPAGSFDAKHVDAVSGFFFPERDEFLYFYMGYPDAPQPRAVSPWGSAQAVAAQGAKERGVRKLGVVLPPCQKPGHWASGYVGGVQILPGAAHRWIALANASPTAPRPEDRSVHREEPPPSLGGFAWCDQQWPVAGWAWAEEPMEWIEDLPPEALADGEGVNLWRHHAVVRPDGKMLVFYNSGTYGKEQLYAKIGG